MRVMLIAFPRSMQRKLPVRSRGISNIISVKDAGSTSPRKYFSDAEGKKEIELSSTVIPAAHDLTETPAKEATCTEDGNTAYYTCSVCKKYFSDAEGKEEIELSSTVIPAAHTLTETPAKEATCTEDGNTAYYTCSVCKKYFSDAEGKKEIELSSTVIPAAHDLTQTPAKEATCTEDGNTAYGRQHGILHLLGLQEAFLGCRRQGRDRTFFYRDPRGAYIDGDACKRGDLYRGRQHGILHLLGL